jgi:hypothetical protein
MRKLGQAHAGIARSYKHQPLHPGSKLERVQDFIETSWEDGCNPELFNLVCCQRIENMFLAPKRPVFSTMSVCHVLRRRKRIDAACSSPHFIKSTMRSCCSPLNALSMILNDAPSLSWKTYRQTNAPRRRLMN